MNRKIFKSVRALPFFVATLVSACAANGQQPEQVVIAPIGSGGTVSSGMTREELEDHVRRFADRYYTRIALVTRLIRNETDSDELKRLMHDWKMVSHAAIVEVAIGPNAVTNLLDMMTLTRLSRLVVESLGVRLSSLHLSCIPQVRKNIRQLCRYRSPRKKFLRLSFV